MHSLEGALGAVAVEVGLVVAVEVGLVVAVEVGLVVAVEVGVVRASVPVGVGVFVVLGLASATFGAGALGDAAFWGSEGGVSAGGVSEPAGLGAGKGGGSAEVALSFERLQARRAATTASSPATALALVERCFIRTCRR